MRLYVKDSASLTLYFFPSVRSEVTAIVVKPARVEGTRLRICHFHQIVTEGRNKDYAYRAARSAKIDGVTFVDLGSVHQHCVCFWVIIKDRSEEHTSELQSH